MREMKDSGVAWIEDIPVNWGIIQLSSVVRERKHKNIGMSENNLLSLSYGRIKQKDIKTSDGLLPDSFEGYNIIEPGDIVLRLTDLQNDHTSLRTGLCKQRGIITSAYVTLANRGTSLTSEYLHYALHSFDIKKGFYGMGAGVRQGLNYDGVKRLLLPKPTINEQKAITKHLNITSATIDKLIANQEQQIEKLKAYKQSLITEVVTKGLNPDAPMKPSGVEWIGIIPEGWKLNRLKYCCSYNDEVLKETEDGNKVIEYVEIGSVTLEDGITATEQFSFSEAPSRARRITKTGDIIVSTVRTYLRAIASIKRNNLIVSTGFCVIRPKGQINNKYVEYYCKSNLFCDLVSSNSYGISYPAITATALMDFHIIQPTDKEQKQIADYLDEKCAKIDRLIEIKQQKIEKLNDYKKSLIYEYITGKKEVI